MVKKKGTSHDKQEATNREKRKKRLQIKRFVTKSIVITGTAGMVYFFLIGFVPQHGNQMFPAVKDGDLVLTFRPTIQYHADAVAAYKTPDGSSRLGRIVAMPGDSIDITEEGRLEVNGLLVSEEIFYPTEKKGDQIDAIPMILPEDSYYILNDHRAETDDSRSYGAIHRKDMMGEAFWLFRRRSF